MADRRLLIAAGQAVPSAAQLPDGVRMVIDAAEEILVISPMSPTHLLIGLREEDCASWQERGLLEALHERLRIPITVFDVAST